MAINVIITGATGMVGEGVLLECLAHPEVKQVLSVTRKSSAIKHPKLKECIVPDFLQVENFTDQLKGYQACFYCAGISSVGMNEAAYTKVTYDIPILFANTLVKINPGMVFSHISGAHTDSSENGRTMWARVKGKAENALMRLPFKGVYNFRPGLMKPTKGQKNIKTAFKIIASLYPVLSFIFPGRSCTLREVGLAMINSALKGYPKAILEVKDIKTLASQ